MEHQRPQPPAIHRSIRVEDAGSKLANHGIIRCPARLQNLVAQFIRADQITAQVRQRAAHEALAAGEPARQSYAEHVCRSASATVLAISMAIVRGPTPPGTGV